MKPNVMGTESSIGPGRWGWLTLCVCCLLVAACVVEKKDVPGDPCVGGVLADDGTCAPKCKPELCAPGNTCVNNACRLECSSHSDCAIETQSCSDAAEDDTERATKVCTDNGKTRLFGWLGLGSPCPGGTECNQAFCVTDNSFCDPAACGGNPASCMADPSSPGWGKCAGTNEPCLVTTCNPADCRYSTYCPNGSQCDNAACGGNPAACVQNEAACRQAARLAGQDEEAFLATCNYGSCGTEEGAPSCVFNTCAANECRQMACQSEGQGDARAYCTLNDCADDSACPSGYHCGASRVAGRICGGTCQGGTCAGGYRDGKSCTSDSSCQKGSTNLCPESAADAPCLDPSTFSADGQSLFEGSFCLMRKSCLLNDECAPCESDLDCEGGDGERCVSMAEGKVCARSCDDQSNCRSDETCSDVDGAKACLPASGKCRGGASFCSHCVDDTDCGDKDSGLACHPNGCYDPFFSTSCQTDDDCPVSPSGAKGFCMMEPVVSPNSSVYKKCYFPYNADADAFGCYPANLKAD